MEDNYFSQNLNTFNKTTNLTLEEFEKQLPRKMTIRLLSNELDDCKKFIKKFTGESMKNTTKLENIKKKINLYSFMNYIIYKDVSELMKEIEEKITEVSKHPKSSIFSEVLIILENIDLKNQIDEIRSRFKGNRLMKKYSYYIPFLIIISPEEIELKDFFKPKTFYFKITLKEILNINIPSILKGKKEEINPKISDFIRKLNVLFCYYNELGDEFSFINSENKLISINIEDDINITVFVNFLLLGRTGSGKSTLINIFLEEMKSLEGGATGYSTTSKKIIVYKKKGRPIRFYDVKGIESEKSVDNYDQIMEYFNFIKNISHDSINTIFYCIQYNTYTTIITEEEYRLFEKLIQFNVPIIFIITRTPYDPDSDEGLEEDKIPEREIIENAIYDLINDSFKKNNKENEAQKFINDYINITYVNLVEIKEKHDTVPIFGINKIFSYLSKLVPENNWNDLKTACDKRDKEGCKKLLQENIFLRYYSEFENLKNRNKEEAKNYLKGLKAGAFFSGMVPGLDIGMEYLYKSLFKEKLKSLYGFDYNKAVNELKKKNFNVFDEKRDENECNVSSINDVTDCTIDEEVIDRNDVDNKENEKKYKEEEKKSEDDEIKNDGKFDETDNLIDKENNNIKDIDNKENEEKYKEDEKKSEDDEIKNAGKNAGSIIRGFAEVGGIVIKALPEAGAEAGAVVARTSISAGLKLASWILLPVTCVGFGTWSLIKVHLDCEKILNTFEKASSPLILETLYEYVKSVKDSIEYLKNIGENNMQGD